MSQQRIEQIKKAFKMQPHPEGGYYCEQHRSSSQVSSPTHGKLRASLTHIYFLLTEHDVSRWHKVVHDEIWNVYEGDPLRILTLNNEGIEDTIIGGITCASNSDYYKIIPGGEFQAAESTGSYTLVGCSVAPGFDFEDFSYIEEQSMKEFVISKGKDYAKFI